MNLERIQSEVLGCGLDGWLFYDFHNRDLMSLRILGLDEGREASRRWFYWVPARGEPVKLAHRVEPAQIDQLPGRKRMYLAWTELHQALKEILGGPGKRIAMQYSPLAAIPSVSVVDAGTVDLIRSFGHEVVSSAELVQTFEATIDEEGFQTHVEAGRIVQGIKDEAFLEIETALRAGREVSEYDIQQFIARRFGEDCLEHDHDPIVGVNEHPANPHFFPTKENARIIAKGDKILIDLWARLKRPGSIYYDVTWCGYAGRNPPKKYVEIFEVARDARNRAVEFIREKFAKGDVCYGYEVDDACREVIQRAGYGPQFVHRTGHSIGQSCHGNGVNIDNLETRDVRAVSAGTCFSIEPGIYLEGEMAVRTEIDVFVTTEGGVVVAGPEQDRLITMDI
ncbi:MAG: M24 family metallopeptidase [Planctomycetota bacterium]